MWKIILTGDKAWAFREAKINWHYFIYLREILNKCWKTGAKKKKEKDIQLFFQLREWKIYNTRRSIVSTGVISHLLSTVFIERHSTKIEKNIFESSFGQSRAFNLLENTIVFVFLIVDSDKKK